MVFSLYNIFNLLFCGWFATRLGDHTFAANTEVKTRQKAK
jgi:hypothetical protein